MMSASLRDWLGELRQHPLWPELIKTVPTPRLRRYKPSREEPLDEVGARHAYESGRVDEYESWVAFLTGGPPDTRREGGFLTQQEMMRRD